MLGKSENGAVYIKAERVIKNRDGSSKVIKDVLIYPEHQVQLVESI